MSRFNYRALAQDLTVLMGRPVTEQEARAVKRDIVRHQSLQEAAYNHTLTDRQQANENGVKKRLRAFFGPVLDSFNGDPRGATVKLIDPRDGEQPTFKNHPGANSFAYFSRDWGGHLIFTGYR